jgi:hypothetical protein
MSFHVLPVHHLPVMWMPWEASRLRPPASLVPVLGLHDVVGHAHRGELAMEVVAEGPRLTDAVAPALRAAFQAVYLAPLDSQRVKTSRARPSCSATK